MESCLSQVETKSIELWHHRLGHLSHSSLAKMKKGGMVSGMELPNVDLSKHIGCDGVCDACMSGKQSFV